MHLPVILRHVTASSDPIFRLDANPSRCHRRIGSTASCSNVRYPSNLHRRLHSATAVAVASLHRGGSRPFVTASPSHLTWPTARISIRLGREYSCSDRHFASTTRPAVLKANDHVTTLSERRDRGRCGIVKNSDSSGSQQIPPADPRAVLGTGPHHEQDASPT